MAQFMLSLASNPYDPFDEYDLWSWFDRKEGFDTAGLLARCVSTSDVLPQNLQDQAVEDAVDSIVNNIFFTGLYKKVQRKSS